MIIRHVEVDLIEVQVCDMGAFHDGDDDWTIDVIPERYDVCGGESTSIFHDGGGVCGGVSIWDLCACVYGVRGLLQSW